MKSCRASWPDHLRAAVLDRLGRDQLPGQPRGHQRPAEAHRRAPGACWPSRCRATRSGARPCSAPTADAVVAVLGVEVVLDDQPLAALGPLDQRRAALAAEHAPVGNWCAGVTTTALAPVACERVDAQALARRPGSGPPRGRPARRSAGARASRGPRAAIALDPAAAQPAAEQREALREAGADRACARGRRRRRGRARGSRRATSRSSRHAARVGVADRVERRLAPGGAQRAQPAVAREAGEVGQARVEVVGEASAAASAPGARGAGARTAARDPHRRRPGGSGGSPRRRAGRRPR